MDKQRFQRLCARNTGRACEQHIEAWFDSISDHYQEPHRHYHTPEHVEHCLAQFDLVRSMLEQPDAVEFAVWYHDAVFNTECSDNERRSAQLFEQHAGSCMDAALVRAVRQLIMVTVHTQEVPQTSDQRYMVDIDLSGFGKPWPGFIADSCAVRREFEQLSDDEFYPSQERFLKALMARPDFCFTSFFKQRHEQQARQNICRYLGELQRQGKL